MMWTLKKEKGTIRARSVIEFAMIFVLVYVLFQAAPIVVLRINFQNELQVIANAPVEESAATMRRRVLETAEGYGIALNSDQLFVERNRETNKSTIDVTYQLYINFSPRFVYVWNVHDRVEALLY
jgi:hypothetical protein